MEGKGRVGSDELGRGRIAYDLKEVLIVNMEGLCEERLRSGARREKSGRSVLHRGRLNLVKDRKGRGRYQLCVGREVEVG